MALRLWICFCLLPFALSELESLQRIAPDIRRLLNRPSRRLLAPSEKQVGAVGRRIKVGAVKGGWKVERNAGRCEWNGETSSCVPSGAATVSHLQDSDNAYAQLVSNFGACAALDSKEACQAKGCLWDGRSAECSYADFIQGYEGSPCLKHVPATAASLVAGSTCPVHTTNLECYQHSECAWDEEEHICEDDGLQFYFGMNTQQFEQATTEVTAWKTAQLIPAFVKSFDPSSRDFDWQKVIDWKPKSKCPPWSDQLICDYVDAVLEYVGQGFYCGARYSRGAQFKECQADPLCEFRQRDLTCVAPDAHYAPGSVEGLRRMAKAIEHDGDKEYIETTLMCNGIRERDECVKHEPCQWNPNDEECDVHGTWIADLIAKPGKDGSDPICMLAKAYGESGCLDKTELEGSESCESDPKCEIRTNGDCYGSPEYLLDYALEHDKDLKASYGRLQSGCKKYRKKWQCLRAKF